MVALKDGRSNTMKCDNANVGFTTSSTSPPPQSSSTAQEQCPVEESFDNKDMQMIYNKKRRFHHQPNRLCRSLEPETLNPLLEMRDDDNIVNDEEEEEEDIDENEECLIVGEKFKLSAQKSKLLLPPHLYKSFLANAFRAQKSNATNKPTGSESDYRAFNACPATNFNGGLHIFPRNLLFSCSIERKTPPNTSNTNQSWPQRPKQESTSRNSPPSSIQEVHMQFTISCTK